MNRRTLPVAAALAATATLLLTACGGGDDKPKANDKIAGADQTATKSPSPSASAPDVAGRPKVQLPKDVKDVYEGWKTGDAAKDAVLADSAARIDVTNEAIVRGETGGPSLSFYYRDKGMIGAVKWVQDYLDANLSYTGTVRYYSPKVSLTDAKSATVIYCADESKAYNKNRKTGKVDKSPSDESPFLLYNTRLAKNAQGVWQTTNLTSNRGNHSCE